MFTDEDGVTYSDDGTILSVPRPAKRTKEAVQKLYQKMCDRVVRIESFLVAYRDAGKDLSDRRLSRILKKLQTALPYVDEVNADHPDNLLVTDKDGNAINVDSHGEISTVPDDVAGQIAAINGRLWSGNNSQRKNENSGGGA